jgi:hypothetical protein
MPSSSGSICEGATSGRTSAWQNSAFLDGAVFRAANWFFALDARVLKTERLGE